MLFDNCIIQAPDGVQLSRCGLKKARWYIVRNLADIVSENPTTIRLRFEPSGRCGIDDPLLIEGKPNICVVCGDKEDLTRHHIIPYSFIKHMKVEYKVDIIRDIFPLCEDCHHEYEKKSWEKRQQIAEELGIPIHGIEPERMRRVRKASGAAIALKKYGHSIPQERQQELQKMICDFTGNDVVTEKDMEELTRYRVSERPDYVPFSKHVADRVENYSEFAREWREHFVATMQPKYMPEAWAVDRITENVWVPMRIRKQMEAKSLSPSPAKP